MLEQLTALPRYLLSFPTNVFVLIGVGLALRRRWPFAGSTIAGSGLLVLTFLSSNAGAGFLVAPLEGLTAPLKAPELANAQAIVVLAAGRLQHAPEYEDRDIPDYIALGRLRYAAHLQRRTGLPVLVSGGNGNQDAYTKADAMATALREDFGVPVKWIETRSRNTAENGAHSAVLLRKDGVGRVLLVTDAMHMQRSKAAFERTGLEVIGAPTMFFRNEAKGFGAWLPSAEGMRRSKHAIHELIGIAWYRLRTGTEEVSAASASGRLERVKGIEPSS